MPFKKPLHVPSLVLGIISVASFLPTLGIGGIVCGIIGLVFSRRERFMYRTKAAFVLSLIGLILGVIFPVAFIIILTLATRDYQAWLATVTD